MSTKKELVLNALHNEEVDRIPVGFWFHFLEFDEFEGGLSNPEILKKNLEGHRKFKESFDPDFVKIMTDGFFYLPYDFTNIKKVEDLKQLKLTEQNKVFVEKNVELVKGVREVFGEDIPKQCIAFWKSLNSAPMRTYIYVARMKR